MSIIRVFFTVIAQTHAWISWWKLILASSFRLSLSDAGKFWCAPRQPRSHRRRSRWGPWHLSCHRAAQACNFRRLRVVPSKRISSPTKTACLFYSVTTVNPSAPRGSFISIPLFSSAAISHILYYTRVPPFCVHCPYRCNLHISLSCFRCIHCPIISAILLQSSLTFISYHLIWFSFDIIFIWPFRFQQRWLCRLALPTVFRLLKLPSLILQPFLRNHRLRINQLLHRLRLLVSQLHHSSRPLSSLHYLFNWATNSQNRGIFFRTLCSLRFLVFSVLKTWVALVLSAVVGTESRATLFSGGNSFADVGICCLE